MLALLIGAPTRGLAGVDHDLAGMAALVRARGGEPVVLPRATPPSIRRALAALVDRCSADDPVLLYLTGHGSALVNAEHDSRAVCPAPARLSYFITVADAGDDGLFDLELSLWCARLAGKTRNVAAILDCCHSGALVRDDGRDDVGDRRLAAFLAWRAAHQREIDALDVEAHPDVVRLAAAGIDGRAWVPGERSALTSALLAELAEAGDAASWVALFAGIERRLARAGLSQQPRLSGPVRRRVFSLAEALPPGAVPVRREDGRILLAAGHRHGVRRGDLFLVDDVFGRVCHVDDLAPTHAVLRPRDETMSPGTVPGDHHLSPEAARPACDVNMSSGTYRSAHAVDLSPETARPARDLNLSPKAARSARAVDLSPGTAPPLRPASDVSFGPGAYATPLRLRGHGGLALRGPSARTGPLARALAGAGWDVHAAPDHALAVLECSDAAIVIHPAGAPACAVLAADDLAGLLAVLQRLARSARLQHLGAGGLGALAIRAGWGRVRAGVCAPLPPRGAELAADDAVFVRLENAADGRRFVSVFWLADDGEVALLSRSESMGIELPPRTTHVLGARPFARAARGVVLPRRPVAPGERRHERLVVVAAAHRQALWSFESPRPASAPHRGDDGTCVEVFAFTVLTAAPPP